MCKGIIESIMVYTKSLFFDSVVNMFKCAKIRHKRVLLVTCVHSYFYNIEKVIRLYVIKKSSFA